MSVKTVTYYQVECDGCGASAHEGDYSAWADDGSAITEAAAQDWLTEIGEQRLDFCPNCSAGHGEDPCVECSHNKVTPVAEKQWKCDDCGLELGKPGIADLVSADPAGARS